MMRKIPIDGKIIFISTVDCGYGQNLARILATNGAIVLGGCVDPTADSVSNLRDYSIYLVKFETSSDEKIDEGIGRVKLRHGFMFRKIIWLINIVKIFIPTQLAPLSAC